MEDQTNLSLMVKGFRRYKYRICTGTMPEKSWPFNRGIHKYKNITSPSDLQQCKNPFIPDIMEATLLSNWKSLAIKKYDGTIDPDEHLDIYITQVRLYTIGSVVLCWVFPTSLKG
ncbi:hypothetical protein JHK86_055805 [Glycine max]|nr:hypothetical protein JHK86_055805 [Glycine max]